MLAIMCVMICNLSTANSKNTHSTASAGSEVAIRRGLFGCRAVLIRAICTVAALDLDPQCFPELDGLHLASVVFPFSATSSCELGFKFSEGSRAYAFLFTVDVVCSQLLIYHPAFSINWSWMTDHLMSLMATKALEKENMNRIQILTNGKGPAMLFCLFSQKVILMLNVLIL